VIIPSREGSKKSDRWKMPSTVYWGSWIVLGAGYTVSGYLKWISPSWIDGSTVGYVFATALTNNFLYFGTLLAMFPLIGKVMTWSAAFMQVTSAPAYLFPQLRKWSWIIMTFIHIFILVFFNLKQVSIGMLIFHAFVMDLDWFKKKNSK
jgi:hypothetical protein